MNKQIKDFTIPRLSTPMNMIPNRDSAGSVGLQMEAPDNIEAGTGYDFLSGWVNILNAGLVSLDGSSIKEGDLTPHSIASQVNNYMTVSDEASYKKRHQSNRVTVHICVLSCLS